MLIFKKFKFNLNLRVGRICLKMSLNADDQGQLKELFNQLDKNKDGVIDFFELSDFLKSHDRAKLEPPKSEVKSVRVNNQLFDLIISSQSSSNQTSFDFRDFVDYVSRTDNQVLLVFQSLDRDKNGVIDKSEIKNAFQDLGVHLDDEQIEKLMKHLDKNNSLQIDWKEWRDFFRFAPHDQTEVMLRYWRTQSFVDYGDQSIPNDYTIKEKQTGLWWRNLVAGGMSGVISRTCTAPLDRVRIYLQVKFQVYLITNGILY